MMKMIKKQVNYVTAHHKITLAFIIIITIVMGYSYTLQKHDNSIGVFFHQDDPIILNFKQFIEEYGNDEFVLVTVETENIFTMQNITLIREVTSALTEIEGVEKVLSLTEMDEIKGEEDTINIKRIIPNEELSDMQLKQIQKKVQVKSS